MSQHTLVTNARIVSDGQIIEGDVLISGQRIAKVGSSIAAPSGAQVIDAGGHYLLPGMIDDQVHFREPGVTYKADMATESRAALAGGITSFMEMPNTKPQTTSLQALDDKFALAADRCWGNYAFYLGATNDNLDELRRLKPGVTSGIKCFMGASTGNMLVDDPEVLDKMFADVQTTIITHCEDSPTIFANEDAARAKYGDHIPIAEHPNIRSREACFKSSKLAVDLARRHGTRLHVLHLTTAEELAHFSVGPVENKRITVEACVHHLYFSADDYAEKGSLIKCNPAIKLASDREALRRAVADDLIDVVATDHAPHTWEEKHAGNYFNEPAGLPLVQHAVPMVLEMVHDGYFDIAHAVKKMCHDPARLFGVVDRGHIREGYFADLILVDMQQPQTVRREDVLYKCGWSPLEGRTLRSRITHTLVNGTLSYANGQFNGGPVGQRLAFDKG